MTNQLNSIEMILNDTKNGKLTALEPNQKRFINEMTIMLLNQTEYTEDDKKMIYDILVISNILYTNYSSEILPLEDGIYDLLMVKCKQVCPDYPVGAIPVDFSKAKISYDETSNDIIDYTYPIVTLTDEESNKMLYRDAILPKMVLDNNYFYQQNTDKYSDSSHKDLNTSHGYPELVGTLDKAKFVCDYQAKEAGAFNEDNVVIFERDFLGKHVSKGLINPNLNNEMVVSLKYDGVSIEADILGDTIVGARSRGDTENDQAMDVTPIFYGYKFPKASSNDTLMNYYGKYEPLKFGMKFEAIITKSNLDIYRRAKNYNYVNCRVAITSIFNSTDGYLYRNLITLVPLQTSLTDKVCDERITEIEFMNKFYSIQVPFSYAVIYGNYTELLFQIKKFTEDAELIRKIMPFMYDGVVVEYTDPCLINTLGRKNSTNQWQMAIKFNPLKRQTIFRGYKFTVGQDGTITPMIYYDPVEFYGTIHDKSSGHSYERFNQLGLRIGDIIDVQYEHDVMPYVSKPDNNHNLNNPEPLFPFVSFCPSCGSPIEISSSGKSARCPNFECPERSLARIVSMMSKLNLKGFADESMDKLARKSLKELTELTFEDTKILGEENGKKFLDRIYHLMTDPIYDYKIIGSLGFENIAEGKWKIILQNMTLLELMSIPIEHLESELCKIKGIGSETVKTIIRELPYFYNDITFIMGMKNVVPIKGIRQPIVRFTGVRDQTLEGILTQMGFDVREGSITKDTNLVIVPALGHQSTKTKTAEKYGIPMIPIQEVYQRINNGINIL